MPCLKPGKGPEWPSTSQLTFFLKTFGVLIWQQDEELHVTFWKTVTYRQGTALLAQQLKV